MSRIDKEEYQYIKYFDDLNKDDQYRVEELLSNNYLKKMLKFKNANGKEMTCVRLQSDEKNYLIILDKKITRAQYLNKSYRFRPIDEVFDLDEYD